MRLAGEYGYAYVEEYSRSYVIEEGRELTIEDVMPIVRGQMAAECAASGRVVLLDSNPLASAVYSQWYYGAVPQELEQVLAGLTYDLYLLCYPDIRCRYRSSQYLCIFLCIYLSYCFSSLTRLLRSCSARLLSVK